MLLSLLTHLDAGHSADVLELLDRVGVALAPQDEALAAVQVDLRPDYEGAESLAASLREELAAADQSLDVFVEIIPGDVDLPPSYRVGVGPFVDFEAAERAKLALEELGVDGFVRELEPSLGC